MGGLYKLLPVKKWAYLRGLPMKRDGPGHGLGGKGLHERASTS
jgi:hypothetical protein